MGVRIDKNQGGSDLAGEQLADGKAQSGASGAAAMAGLEKVGLHVIGDSRTFVGHQQSDGASRVAQCNRHPASGRGCGDCILDEIGGDQADQAAAITVEAVLEISCYVQGNALVGCGGGIAAPNGIGQILPLEKVGELRLGVSENGDRFLNHVLEPSRIVSGRFPVAGLDAFKGAVAHHCAEAGHRSLHPVDKMRSDLAQG